MVEREQVVLPLRIDDIEHDNALVSAHRFDADLLLLRCILGLGLPPDSISHFLRSELLEVDAFSINVQIVDGLDLKSVVIQVPILWRDIRIEILAGKIGKQIVGNTRLWRIAK